MMQRIYPPARRIVASFERNQGAELILVAQRQFETNIAAHRLAHDHGLFQFQCMAKGNNEFCVELRRELVFILHQVEVLWRKRLAMPRHVERDHAEIVVVVRIANLMTVLAAIGAGRVEANHWHAFAALFVIGAICLALALNVNVAANNWIMLIHRILLMPSA